jgi:DNA-binding NtrC family response regulator
MDDDELLRWSAAEGLREHGYHVEEVADANEALELCPGAAAALLDHDSRQTGGLDLADMLHGQCPGCAIVLMAADPTPELRRDAQRRHVVRVLEKPFSLEDLVDAIRYALRHSPILSSSRPAAENDPGDRPLETRASRGV